jgi:hypothetical protein
VTVHVPLGALWFFGCGLYLIMAIFTVKVAGLITMDMDGWWLVPFRLFALVAWPAWWVLCLAILLVVLVVSWVIELVTG